MQKDRSFDLKFRLGAVNVDETSVYITLYANKLKRLLDYAQTFYEDIDDIYGLFGVQLIYDKNGIKFASFNESENADRYGYNLFYRSQGSKINKYFPYTFSRTETATIMNIVNNLSEVKTLNDSSLNYFNEIKQICYEGKDVKYYQITFGGNLQNIIIDGGNSPQEVIAKILKLHGYKVENSHYYKALVKYKNLQELQHSKSTIYIKATLLDKETGKLTSHISYYGYQG